MRLFAVVREDRFLTMLRLIYACGLRVSEAARLEVGDLRGGERVHVREAKGQKERFVPLPPAMADELRVHWKTHRHPRLLFPGVGRGWRESPGAIQRLSAAKEPMGVGSIPALHAPGGRRRTAAQGDPRAYATPFLRDAPSSRSWREHPAHLRLPRPQFAGDHADLHPSDRRQ